MTERDPQKIEAVKKILLQHFSNPQTESVFLSFQVLAQNPFLKDPLGVKRIFGIIADTSNKNISFEVLTGRSRLPTITENPEIRMSDLYPIGLQVYVSDPAKLNDFFDSILNYPIRLSDYRVTFDDATGTIVANGRRVSLHTAKHEHCLCRVLFDNDNPVGTPVDWDVIYEKMTGLDPLDVISSLSGKEKIEGATRSVRDAMRSVNERVQNALNTRDSLFSWEKKTIKRNF